LAGAIVAMPMLLTLAGLAAPFGGGAPPNGSLADALDALPMTLWLALPGLPACAALIGFLTAQGTVRRWLRRLP
jgi:cell division transport system permease protein